MDLQGGDVFDAAESVNLPPDVKRAQTQGEGQGPGQALGLGPEPGQGQPPLGVQDARGSVVAVLGIFLLVSIIVFIVITLAVVYYANPEVEVYGGPIVEKPKFLTKDKFSYFVSMPLEILERKSQVLMKQYEQSRGEKADKTDKAESSRMPVYLPPSPLIAQLISPLARILRKTAPGEEPDTGQGPGSEIPQDSKSKSKDKSHHPNRNEVVLIVLLYGTGNMVALSREKRTCKEIPAARWLQEHRSFFSGRTCKFSGSFLPDSYRHLRQSENPGEEKGESLLGQEQQDQEQPLAPSQQDLLEPQGVFFYAEGRIELVKGEEEGNICKFLLTLNRHTLPPEFLSGMTCEKEEREHGGANFNGEEIEMLIY